MRRDYEWVEKLDSRTKRTIRVGFPGGGRIVWMCRTSNDDRWNREMTPTSEEWDLLERKIRARYNRRRAGCQDVDLVVALRNRGS